MTQALSDLAGAELAGGAPLSARQTQQDPHVRGARAQAENFEYVSDTGTITCAARAASRSGLIAR